MKNIFYLLFYLLLSPLLLLADVAPQNVLGINCLKGYKTTYKSHTEHKAFFYAREAEGKDRCSWAYGHASVAEAKKSALGACAKYNLNAECKLIDLDGVFLVKKGDFSYLKPVDNTPLNSKELEERMADAKDIVLGNCLPFFKKYLEAKGHKSFGYSLDKDGKYACGNSYSNQTEKISKSKALKSCQNNKLKRGKNKPKTPCKVYAVANDIILKAKDYDVEIIKKSEKYLTSSEYKRYLDEVKEIIDEGACLFQMKYYLRGTQHQAYFLAKDKKGKQACGRAEGAFSPTVAKEKALKKCQEDVKKKKLKATCKLYAQNFELIGKAEDFGIKKGIDDYKNAIFKGKLKKIKGYVEEGADINMRSKDGITPIFVAVGNGDEEFFHLLIKKGASIEHKVNDGSSLLIAAAFGGNPNILRELLDKGLEINAKGKEGNTALHVALGSVNFYLAEVLMQEGADGNIKNDKGITADTLAKKWEIDLEKLKTIDLSKKDDNVESPLFDTVKYGDVKQLQKLIDMKMNVNLSDALGRSLLVYAKINVVSMLVKAGANLNAKDDYGETPLMNGTDDLERIKLFLSLGADKDIKNNEGKTVYDMVKDSKHIDEELKKLLK